MAPAASAPSAHPVRRTGRPSLQRGPARGFCSDHWCGRRASQSHGCVSNGPGAIRRLMRDQLSKPTLSIRLAAAFDFSAIDGERHRLGIELAEGRDRRIDRDAGADRIFEVQVRVHLLRLFAGQPFDQLHRVGLVGRMAGEHDAGDVHMGAAALEGRQDDAGGVRPRLLRRAVEHQPVVISVADAEVALAGRDVARGLAVAAGRPLREIGLEAAQPLLGLRLAVLDDVRGEQRDVVDSAGRSGCRSCPSSPGWRDPRSSARSASRAPSRRRPRARASRRAYQCPSGSRYCGATTLSSSSDLIGWVMPARTASSSRLMSTVSSTSAGLLAPSVRMRCSSPLAADTTLTLMPVSLVKASNSGWISLVSR